MHTAPAPIATTGGLLTTAEVARNRRRSAQTVRLWVAQGMPCRRVNNRLYFDPAEVEAWHARDGQAPATDHRAVIKRLVDAAPKLTDEQAERIRTVLTGGAA